MLSAVQSVRYEWHHKYATITLLPSSLFQFDERLGGALQCTGVLKPESVKVNQMERAIKSVKATVASMRGEQGDPFDFKLSNRWGIS